MIDIDNHLARSDQDDVKSGNLGGGGLAHIDIRGAAILCA